MAYIIIHYLCPMKLNIGFDAKRIVRNGTGLGNYGRTLVNSLSNVVDDNCRLLLYAPDEGRDDLRSQVSINDKMKFVYSGKRFRLLKDYWRSYGIIKDLKRDGVGIFHGLSGELPIGLQKNGIHSIVTIHDLIFLRHPEYYNPIDVQIYKHKFRQTLREAGRIVAISDCTKRDILAYGDYPEERIDVVYQSCGIRFKKICDIEQKTVVEEKYQLPKRYILNVGTIEERKNVMLVIKAMLSLPTDIHLVIIGKHTKYTDCIIDFAIRNNLYQRVHIFHGVPTEDLYAIYQNAECFVYPSRYEGFGIPIIEAIQSGLPVVAATGSCLEEAGGPDCIYVNPDDAEAMSAAILKSLKGNDDIEQRISKCQQYVTRFENTDIACRMLDVYKKILG